MPTEKQVQSTPISIDGEDDVVIEQENTGARNMRGSGEWPSPETPPEPGAVGGDPSSLAEVAGDRETAVAEGEPRPASSHVDTGLAREIDPPSGYAAANEADPIVGGTSTAKGWEDPEDSDR